MAIMKHKSRRGQGEVFFRLQVTKKEEKRPEGGSYINLAPPAASPKKMPSISMPAPSPKGKIVGLPKMGALQLKKIEDPPFIKHLKDPTRERYPWEVPYSHIGIDESRLLGRGAFGEVYLGMYNEKKVAIKRVLSSIKEIEVLEDFVKEVDLMSKFHHINVLGVEAGSLEYPNLCCITEFMGKGDVHDVLKKGCSWPYKLKLAVQAARGLQYLHHLKPPVVHRDLKSYNFLVADDDRVVLCDFGVSEVLETEANRKATKWGTVNWMPPEVFDKNIYDLKSDVFSFGMVLWEFVTVQVPFGDANPLTVLQLVENGDRPFIPAACPPSFKKLITECWSQSPDQRPDIDLVVKTLEEISLEMEPMDDSPKEISISVPQ
eukprot:TRINITY_DN281_c0_g1_i4.p1 TRINITY_DN281_c0_g1~~TRINITY_DN281_c0_g1_i4.p1  ORF type:complete len:375 (-),score=70.00 TRINITY_DN281_c0_g1_i4:82-1206(-)